MDVLWGGRGGCNRGLCSFDKLVVLHNLLSKESHLFENILQRVVIERGAALVDNRLVPDVLHDVCDNIPRPCLASVPE